MLAAGCGRFAFEVDQVAGDDAAVTPDAPTAGYARTIADDTPLAYWRFESTATIVDETGRGHDGTMTGGVTSGTGIVGSGVVLSRGGEGRFDGGRMASAAADFLFDGNAPFTLECWVYPTRIAGYWTQLFQTDNFDSMGRRNGYTIEYLDDHVHVIRRRNGVEQEAVAYNAMQIDRWIHLAGTYDGTSLRMYVDGVLRDVQASALAMLSDATTPFSVSDGEYTLTGTLDECAIYGYALDEARIAAHHAAGRTL